MYRLVCATGTKGLFVYKRRPFLHLAQIDLLHETAPAGEALPKFSVAATLRPPPRPPPSCAPAPAAVACPAPTPPVVNRPNRAIFPSSGRRCSASFRRRPASSGHSAAAGELLLLLDPFLPSLPPCRRSPPSAAAESLAASGSGDHMVPCAACSAPRRPAHRPRPRGLLPALPFVDPLIDRGYCLQ